jgi:hypothetical protein
MSSNCLRSSQQAGGSESFCFFTKQSRQKDPFSRAVTATTVNGVDDFYLKYVELAGSDNSLPTLAPSIARHFSR